MGRREHEPVEVPRDIDIKVGARIRMARFRAKLTMEQLARRVDTDEAEIESWETGTSVIYIDELMALCKALDTTPNRLLLGLEA